jgi:site-specific recombinase XerD
MGIAVLVQRVLPPDGSAESWTVLGDDYAVVEPIDGFLAHLTAIERSPGTVRSYAFDLRDYFEFLDAHGIDWRTVRLEHLGRFVGWLRLAPTVRSATITSLPVTEPHCSAVTINRKLAAVGSFYKFHHRHGVDCAELFTTIKPGGATGSWRPFLAHLGSEGDNRRRTIKLKTRRLLPRTLDPKSMTAVFDACDRLRDRFLIELLAGSGMRIGEALGLRHEDIDAAGTLIRVRLRDNSNGARVKGGQREIPVAPSLIRLYTDYLVEEYGDLDCGYVFVNLWGGTAGTPWRDIVIVPSWFTCCGVSPEMPSIQGWIEATTSLGRLIFFDQPGVSENIAEVFQSSPSRFEKPHDEVDDDRGERECQDQRAHPVRRGLVQCGEDAREPGKHSTKHREHHEGDVHPLFPKPTADSAP